MRRHRTKEDFHAISVTVIALNFFSAIIFMASVLIPIFFFNGELLGGENVSPIHTTFYSLSGLFISLALLSFAELLQLFMKVESNLNVIKRALVPEEKKTAIPSPATKTTKATPKSTKQESKKTNSRKSGPKTTNRKRAGRKKASK